MCATGIVQAVCISSVRGVQKQAMTSARLTVGWGLEGDAHGGNWHRQVSLLSYQKVLGFNQQGAGVDHGDFGENIVVEGIDFSALPVGTVLECGSGLLEITQIGKECHRHCQIYQRMGDCIMPREGVFATVLRDGQVSPGDTVRVVAPTQPAPYRAAVVTLSDKGASGQRQDKSGPLIQGMLEQAGYTVVETVLLPDSQQQIEAELRRLADMRQVDLLLTTGGTGFSRRDVTPEATMAVAHRNAPGIAEAIRAYSLSITGRAMLSRGVSVIRGGTVIVNLPGSPKAVEECLGYILPHLGHGIAILKGDAGECATEPALK